MPANRPVPTRYQSGVATSPREYLYGNYPAPTPPRIYEYFNDFSVYAAADWTVTSTSTGTSALAAGNGGLLVQTTAASNNDIQANQLTVTSFAFAGGQQVWFNINVALSDATASLFLAGLANDFATMAPTDGVYFSKAAASTTLNLILRKSSTSTTIAIGTMANATSYSLGFYYNGNPNATLFAYSSIGLASNVAYGQPYYPGGIIVAAAGATPAGFSAPTNPLTNLPTAALTMGFGVKAGAAAIKTSTVDYVLAAQEITARF